jgi:TonB family protein
MTTLVEICGLPLVHALGWTLLHLCWQGTVVAVVLWCVLGVLGGRSSQARYAAACLALGMMIALPLATFAHLASAEYRLRDALDGPAYVLDPGMVLRVGAGEMNAPWPARMAVALDHALPWILLAWFAGVILFVARLNVGLLVARRMRSVATTAPPAELQQAFDALRRRLGVARAVRLMHSALVQVPTVIGWLRPVVLVPASCLTGLSTMQIEAILAHELAHIRRHDYLVSVLQSVIETLLFYHPAVWWVSKQVRRERECCCDELAVAVGGDRLAYARALSVLEERRSYSPEFALGANGGVLKMRIKRLLGCKEDAAVSQFAAFMVLALVVALAGSYVVTVARAEAGAAVSHAARVASPMELEAAAPLNTLIAAPAVREYRLKEPILMAQAEAPAAAPVTSPAQAAPTPPPPPIEPTVPPPAVPSAPGGPVRVSAAVVAGMALSKPNPVYPAEAKAAHVQGAVILHAIISKQGTMEKLSVISGNGMLVASAMDAVKQWTYKPYLLNGQPVEVETSITVNYTFGDPNSMGRGSGTGIGNGSGLGPGSGDGYGTGVKQIGGGVKGPVPIYESEPEYTELARQDKVQGVVLVHLVVDEQGLPQHLHVSRGLGDGLNEKAVEAVRQYRFKPATENGKPVAVWLNVEVNFQLADSTAQTQGPILVAGEAANGVRQVGGDVIGPTPIFQPEPEFSAEAKKAKFEGVVTVSLIVDKNGLPQNVHVTKGVGHGLDEKAVEAVKKYRFKPATENGKPVAVFLNVEVNFEIF